MNTTLLGTPPTATSVAPSSRLRVLGVLTALAGVWTLVTAQLVPPPVAVLTGAVIAASAAASSRLRSESAMRLRRQIAVLVLGLASVAALVANGGGEVSDSTATVLGLLLCAAAGAHGLVVDTVRDARVNLAVSVSMLLLAAGLAPGLGIAAPVVVTWCCAVATLVVASGEAQGADVEVRASTAEGSGGMPPAAWAGLATSVAVAVLVGVALALVLPHPPEVRARSSFGNGADQSRNPSSSVSRSANAYLGDGPMDLDTRGRLDDRPVALVTGLPGEHWRAAVLATYDGDRWWPVGRDEPAVGLGAPGQTSVAIPADERSPRTEVESTRSDDVTWVGRVAPVLLSPGIATSVEFHNSADLLRTPGRLTVAPFDAELSYTVTSTVQPDTKDAAAQSRADDASNPEWMQLPSTLPARVGQLAKQVAGEAPDRTAAVLAVETYLRQNMTYDLDSPVPPRGRDSVDEFLFTSRSGFCEHFAAAEVVLLRSLGIPSRVVSGFLSGVDETDVDGQERRVLRGTDAHAWVEVWIPGSGWTVSDPTAGVALARGSGTGFTGLVQELVDAATGSGVRKVVIAVVLVVGAALLLLAPRRRRRRSSRSTAVPSPKAPLFAAFHRFEQALEDAGRPREPAESVRALAARIGGTDLDSDEIRRALHVVERASYAPVPPGRDETRDAARAIDDASARLLSARS